MSFIIEGEIELNEDALAKERKKLGRFVLASNKTDLDPEIMLNYYKGQQTVDGDFVSSKIKASMYLKFILRRKKELNRYV